MTDIKNNDIDALLAQVKMMSNLLDNIGSYVYSKDLAGNYTYVNADVAELFQSSVEDIIGKDDSHFFDLKVSNELRNNDLRVIRDKVTVISEEKNIIKSTNKAHIFQIVKKPIFNELGDVVGITGISTDITAQKALAVENQEQKYLLDVILDNVDAYIYMKDTNRYFRYVNSRVADLFGLPAEEIINRRDIDVIPQEFADHFWQTDKLVFESNDKIIINETSEGADNKLHHYHSVKVPCKYKDEYTTLIGFSTDVTELYQLKEKFEQMANIDALTNIYNRRYFFEHANHAFHHAKKHQQALTVIAIDIDHFKAINDQYGHPVGDQVLIKITQLISSITRKEDILARIGGEEFSILLPNTLKKTGHQTAERLRNLLDKTPIIINSVITLAMKISVGVSVIKSTDERFQDLHTRSDIALYKAKSLGRNIVHIID